MGRAAIAAALVAAAVVTFAGRGSGDALSTEATIVIHYSHFEPESVTVAAGVPVTITLRNDDSIEHEWIVGSEAVHQRHRTGTEPAHGDRPTEVSISALEARETTVTFDEAGTLRFVCHLPGHEAYGMTGLVAVH